MGEFRINIEQKGQYRNAIQLVSRRRFNGGLFILDIKHMHVGLATWPTIALMDLTDYDSSQLRIVDGANSEWRNNIWNTERIYRTNSTLYTKGSCTESKQDCNIGNLWEIKKAGCKNEGPHGSFGKLFNHRGGSIFVCEWIKNKSIKLWFFSNKTYSDYAIKILHNVRSNRPNPNMWLKKFKSYAEYKLCTNQLNNVNLIINTKLCGNYAGHNFSIKLNDKRWNVDESERLQLCNNFVNDNNNNMYQAYWQFNSIKYFEYL